MLLETRAQQVRVDLTHDIDFEGETYAKGAGVMVPRPLAIGLGALPPDETEAKDAEAWAESLFTPEAAQTRIESLASENAKLQVSLMQARQLANDQRGAYLGQCDEAQGFQNALIAEQLKTFALQNQVEELKKQVADSGATALPQPPAPSVPVLASGVNGQQPAQAQDAVKTADAASAPAPSPAAQVPATNPVGEAAVPNPDPAKGNKAPKDAPAAS